MMPDELPETIKQGLRDEMNARTYGELPAWLLAFQALPIDEQRAIGGFGPLADKQRKRKVKP